MLKDFNRDGNQCMMISKTMIQQLLKLLADTISIKNNKNQTMIKKSFGFRLLISLTKMTSNFVKNDFKIERAKILYYNFFVHFFLN